MKAILNPYKKQLQELLQKNKNYDTPELQKQIAELEEKSKEFIKDYLDKAPAKLEAMKEQKQAIVIDNKAHYKIAIKLYREALDLFLSLRELKKEMRETRRKK
jgi:hypothetical protein